MSVNLKRMAYDQIRSDLLAGKFLVGSTLSAASLAKELGISHTPVREAICQLEIEGFVEQVPRLGHQVKALDRAELVELFELRQFLEQGAVAEAAKRITAAELAQLTELCDHYMAVARAWTKARDVAEFDELAAQIVRIDAAFHFRLLAAAGNRRLVKLVGDLQLMTFLFRRHVEIPQASAISRVARAHREHCQIVRQLRKHDAEAAVHAVKRHLEGSKRYYLYVFDHSRRNLPAGSDPAQVWNAELLGAIGDEPSQDVERRAARRSKRSRPKPD